MDEQPSSVDHNPSDKWEFDADVTQVFDDMLQKSIPQYEVMRRAVFELGCAFVKDEQWIADLGCSRGEALDPFVRKFGVHNHYVGVEVSDPMIEVCKQRFAGWIDNRVVEIHSLDLRESFPTLGPTCLIMAVLTLQFVPIEHRQRVVREAFLSLAPGGALIVVEKVLGATAEIDGLLVNRYYALKREHGYSQDSIDRKRLSLEGVLVPVTAKWNEELLRMAGFSTVDCFWRWMNFAAWVAVKEA